MPRRRTRETSTVKITLYLPPELRKALMIQALDENESTTSLVERLVTQYLTKKRAIRPTPRPRKRLKGG
jgi:hypothetical protein